MTEQRRCEVPGCEKVHYARGMCRNDYQVAKRKGFAVEEMVAYRKGKPNRGLKPPRVSEPKPRPEPEPPEVFGTFFMPIEAGHVVRSATAPTQIRWQATDREALERIADELGGVPIVKLSKSLYRISVDANHYMDWSLPENIRKLIAA